MTSAPVAFGLRGLFFWVIYGKRDYLGRDCSVFPAGDAGDVPNVEVNRECLP